MSRSRQRLFAWVCLVAFLATDPHAVAALSAFAPTAPCCSQAGGRAFHPATSSDCPEDSSAPCCCRCAKKSQDGTKTPEAKAARPCECPSSPGCPKCPSCPVPGGCHYCNVAKVPCLPVLYSRPAPLMAVADAPAEAAPLYASPSQGRLRRPPKS